MTEYLVIYERGDTSWGAHSPDLTGVAVVGDARQEVERLIRKAIPLHLDGLRENGLAVPKPRSAAGVVAA